MELKTFNKGIYVRLCAKSEFGKPTRLEKMINIAVSDKDQEPNYQIVYFKRNDSEFSKFNEKIELLSGNYYVSGEIFNIVDNFNGNTDYFDREVEINEDHLKVIDSKEPYSGIFHFNREETLYLTFYDSEKNKSFSENFRFIPKNK